MNWQMAYYLLLSVWFILAIFGWIFSDPVEKPAFRNYVLVQTLVGWVFILVASYRNKLASALTYISEWMFMRSHAINNKVYMTHRYPDDASMWGFDDRVQAAFKELLDDPNYKQNGGDQLWRIRWKGIRVVGKDNVQRVINDLTDKGFLVFTRHTN